MARDSTRSRKGVSLAKGPVAILGLVGIVYGLSALLFSSRGFGVHIPHGAVHGKTWIGLEVNGWSELLFIAAGLLLLFAAPLHWGAKSMSLLVGLVLIAAAVIAVIRKDGVFGIFAANHLTELIWAAAGVLLLVLALLPRVGGRTGSEQQEPVTRPRTRTRRAVVEPESQTVSGPAQQPARTETVAEQVQDPSPSAGARSTHNHEAR
jgi:hypothetical protein